MAIMMITCVFVQQSDNADGESALFARFHTLLVFNG